MFPRTSVWIRHEGRDAFLADPNVVTIYNRGQRYERFALSPDGDRCDWFAVSDDLAREIAASFDPAATDSGRPFRFESAASSSALYFRQRAVLAAAARGELDAMASEEQVMAIVTAALALAHHRRPRALARRASAVRRRRELAEAARAELMRASQHNRPVHDLARALGTSPFHLCRVFREHTGATMHAYLTGLRVRLGLEMLEGSARVSVRGISAVALELGFASHSHFVRATRHHLGTTPSVVRHALRMEK